MFGFFFLIPIAFFLLFIWLIVLWVKMLIHAATKPIDAKITWVIVLCLTGWIGALIYYFAVYKPYEEPVKGEKSQS